MTKTNSFNPGDSLPAMQFPPISRATLALYCGGSGDHNPIHVDIDYAKSSGLDDVIAHGMLIKALIGRAITASVNQQLLQRFDTQFMAPTHIGDSITVTADVDGFEDVDGTALTVIKAEAVNQKGITIAKSRAWIKQN